MNNQSYRKNTEHIQEDPPACMRKYVYMYNIAFVTFYRLWYFMQTGTLTGKFFLSFFLHNFKQDLNTNNNKKKTKHTHMD